MHQRLVAAALGRAFGGPGMIDHRPSFPEGTLPGIGIVGCGQIVRNAHLPAYARYGCEIVGVYDVRPEATSGLGQRVFGSLDALLDDPRIEIVDIATHPDVRVELIRRAITSGKHVLAQKPLADDLAAARAVVEEAERAGVTLAVNQNGRWAPPWRIATLLVEQGAIGEVHSVTHLLDRDFAFVLEFPHFDAIEHLIVYDHRVHWVDISRCCSTARRPRASAPSNTALPVSRPRRSSLGCVDRHPLRRRLERDRAQRRRLSNRAPRCPFWIHGTEGTIRGSLLLGSDFVELERDGATERFDLCGAVRRRLRGRDGRAHARRRRGPRAVQLRTAQPPLARADARGGPLGRGRWPAGQADVTACIAAGICSGVRCSRVTRRSGRRSRRNAR